MKFLLDENVDFPLAAVLTDLGHDVTAVAYDYPMSLKDPDVLTIANQEGRVLITNDHDFGELIVRHKLPHSGVILFRLKTEDLATKTQRLTHVLNNYSDELANFLIVSERGVRVRKTT